MYQNLTRNVARKDVNFHATQKIKNGYIRKKKGKKLPQQGCGNQIMMEPWTITPRPSNKRTTWLPCSSFLVFIANMPSPPDADDAKQTHPQRRCSEMSCQCHTVFCQTSKEEKFQSRGQKEGGEKNPQRNQIPPLLLKKYKTRQSWAIAVMNTGSAI